MDRLKARLFRAMLKTAMKEMSLGRSEEEVKEILVNDWGETLASYADEVLERIRDVQIKYVDRLLGETVIKRTEDLEYAEKRVGRWKVLDYFVLKAEVVMMLRNEASSKGRRRKRAAAAVFEAEDQKK